MVGGDLQPVQATLKLTGLPQLQLKGSGQDEGLRLKLGDSSDARRGRARIAKHCAER